MMDLRSLCQEAKVRTLDEFVMKFNHPFLIIHGQGYLDSDEADSKDTELESTDRVRSNITVYPVKEQTDSSCLWLHDHRTIIQKPCRHQQPYGIKNPCNHSQRKRSILDCGYWFEQWNHAK